MLSAVALAVLLSGCVNRVVRVSPARIEAASAELRAGRPVVVEPELGPRVLLRPEQTVDLEHVSGHVVPIRIDALVRECPLDDHPRRLCSAGDVDHVIVGHESGLSENGKAGLSGGVLVGGLVGLGVCWSQCGGPWDTVSAVSLISLGSVVVLSAVAAWGLSWGR